MAGAEHTENSAEKMQIMLGMYNYKYIRETVKRQQVIFHEQLFELHRVLNVQKMLAKGGLRKNPQKISKPSKPPSSSEFPTHNRYRQLDAYDMAQPLPAPTFKNLPNLYAQTPMNDRQIQLPPVPALLYTHNPYLQSSGDYRSTRSSGVTMRPPLGFEFRRPANKDSEPSHSPSGFYAYHMNKTNLPLPAQSTSGSTFAVQNPRDYLRTSSSGVNMRPPMGLEYPRDYLRTGSSGVTMRPPMGFVFPRPANKDSEPSHSPSSLYAYHMNNTNLLLPAQSNSVYNFAVQNPSGVTMRRPPMGLEFQRPANKDSRPSQSLRSSQVSTQRKNMQKLFYYHTNKMKVPMPAKSTSRDDFAIQNPRDYPTASTSEVATMPPVGFDFRRPAYVEDRAGSNSLVNPNSYKMSIDGSDEDSGVDLSLSIAVGDSKGKRKLGSFEPLPSQQSSFSNPAHDLTRRPNISASLNSDQGYKRRDLVAMGGSSSGTIHQETEETQETKWLFRD